MANTPDWAKEFIGRLRQHLEAMETLGDVALFYVQSFHDNPAPMTTKEELIDRICERVATTARAQEYAEKEHEVIAAMRRFAMNYADEYGSCVLAAKEIVNELASRYENYVESRFGKDIAREMLEYWDNLPISERRDLFAKAIRECRESEG